MIGDFNSERHRGWRGDKLEELLCEFGLLVDISELLGSDKSNSL